MLEARSEAERGVHVEVGRRLAEPLLEVQKLAKIFEAGSGRAVTALNGVTIEVGSNESVGLVGESGSGKTTLARCLVGLENPTAGRIVIDGVEATDFQVLSDRSQTLATDYPDHLSGSRTPP